VKRVVLVLLLVAACGSPSSGSPDPAPPADASDCCVDDPRDGDVFIRGPIHKTCDGQRLIYWNVEGGVWGAENSQQCAPR